MSDPEIDTSVTTSPADDGGGTQDPPPATPPQNQPDPGTGTDDKGDITNPDDISVTGDKKPTEPEPKPDADDKKTPPADEGAPETYQAYTLPEGLEIHADDLAVFNPLAKELNLSQANAQKFIDAFVAVQNRQIAADEAKYQEAKQSWLKEIKEDAEIGGEKLHDNMRRIKGAFNHYGDEGFAKLLIDAGLDSHPSVIRFMYKVSKDLGEDQLFNTPLDKTGGSIEQDAKETLDRIYNKS